MVRYCSAILMASISYFASAYPVSVDMDGSILRWDIHRDNPRVTYEVQTDMPAFDGIYLQLVGDAARLWSNVPNSYIELEQAMTGETAQITFNFKDHVGENSHSAGFAVFDDYKGEKPEHCSIYIPTANGSALDDFSKTILHELGHCLGLGHSVIPQSIMSYSLDKNSFALDVDDEAAISRLYPETEDNEKLPPGCSVSKNSSGGRGRWLAILLLPIFLVIRKRMDI